jgi:hypothetical protein
MLQLSTLYFFLKKADEENQLNTLNPKQKEYRVGDEED